MFESISNESHHMSSDIHMCIQLHIFQGISKNKSEPLIRMEVIPTQTHTIIRSASISEAFSALCHRLILVHRLRYGGASSRGRHDGR